MRIRQVKPSFWTDATLAHLSVGARLIYIGLWCAADDAGWVSWDLDELGALLLPYMPPRARSIHLRNWTGELVGQGRVRLMGCGCAVIPTMETHQRSTGGSKSYIVRSRHDRLHRSPDHSGPVRTNGAGTERNGTVSNGSADARDVSDNDGSTTDFRKLVPLPSSLTGRAS
jgi:hypothetical protein